VNLAHVCVFCIIRGECNTMRIGLAQTRPIVGELQRNLAVHCRMSELAAANRAQFLLFPELSLTGYEPALAAELAIDPLDGRLGDLQSISDRHDLAIAAGAPTRDPRGTCISLIVLQPHQPRYTYSKRHLHPDEEPYFVAGPDATGIVGNDQELALAICYELSVPEHATLAARRGAKVYLASVAKSLSGIDRALGRLAEIAREHALIVLMANCLGPCDGVICAGRSTAWTERGELIGQLDDSSEGILVVDTQTYEQQFVSA
jgi:predicted amidohydrolase